MRLPMRWTTMGRVEPCPFYEHLRVISSCLIIHTGVSTYISILRDINGRGGRRRIQMPALTALYRDLGLLSPTSYLESGNIVFDTRRRFSTARLAERLEHAVKEAFHFEATAFVMTVAELKKAVAANPFLKTRHIPPEKLYVTFLAADPAAERLQAILPEKGSHDLFAVMGRLIYLYLPGGYGKTHLSAAYFERRLGVPAATRSWRTVNMLQQMAASR